MKKEYDGPSFVNPKHTSHNLNQNSSYQKPNLIFTENAKNSIDPIINRQSGKPGGGWNDEEEEKNKSYLKKKADVKNVESYFKKEDKTESIKQNNNQNYWEAQNSLKIQSSTLSKEYENKLISDLINAKGVTLKPSDTQLKEFIKRIKSLNKDIISEILYEKISLYSKDNEDIRLLTKCLYLVEEILNNNIDEYNNYFKEKIEIFECIQNSSNKKAVEITENIIYLITGVKKSKVVNKLVSETKNEKFNFIKKKNDNIINELFEVDKLNNQNGNSNNVKNNILDFNQNNNLEKSNTDTSKFSFVKKKIPVNDSLKTEIDTSSKNVVNDISEILSNTSVEPKNEKSKFSFIKATSDNKPKISETKEENNINDLNNKLKEIFSTDAGTSNIPINNFNNIYNININSTNSKKYEAPNFDVLFNYNTPSPIKEEIKPRTENKIDHFDFVNDLMKKK